MVLTLWLFICMIASFSVRIMKHNKVIIASQEKKFVKQSFKHGGYFYLKLTSWIFLAVVLGGSDMHSYGNWWRDYHFYHPIWEFLSINIFFLGILFLMKESSYERELFPGTYRTGEFKFGDIYKINMKKTLVENGLFYLFIIFSPTLPFLKVLVLRSYS